MTPEYPFIEHEGKMYYVTERLPRKGDFVYFDYEGTRKFGYIEYIADINDAKAYFVFVYEDQHYFGLTVGEITVLKTGEDYIPEDNKKELSEVLDKLAHVARQQVELIRKVDDLAHRTSKLENGDLF